MAFRGKPDSRGVGRMADAAPLTQGGPLGGPLIAAVVASLYRQIPNDTGHGADLGKEVADLFLDGHIAIVDDEGVLFVLADFGFAAVEENFVHPLVLRGVHDFSAEPRDVLADGKSN